MKRVIVLLIAVFTTILGNAQNVWSCIEFDNDLAKFKTIKYKYQGYGNKRWSREVLAAFPISNNKTIMYQYVIKTNNTFNVEDIHNSLLSWYKQKLPNVDPNYVGSKDKLSGMGILQNMGSAFGYMSATFINAREEITIDIKENRVRITVEILHYISANSWTGASTVAPGICYPVVSNASQKDSHAMAFINCHWHALNTISSLISYLNNNTNIIQNGDEDW